MWRPINLNYYGGCQDIAFVAGTVIVCLSGISIIRTVVALASDALVVSFAFIDFRTGTIPIIRRFCTTPENTLN